MTNTPDKPEMKACPKNVCSFRTWLAFQVEIERNARTGMTAAQRLTDALERFDAEYPRASSRPPADQVPDMVKAALSPLVNEEMDEAMRDAWLTDLAIAALQAVPAASEAGWQPIKSAPKDGTRILAVTGEIDDERWSSLSRREFVVWHLGEPHGWSLYPGMGVGDGWLAAWRPLPEPPALKASGEE